MIPKDGPVVGTFFDEWRLCEVSELLHRVTLVLAVLRDRSPTLEGDPVVQPRRDALKCHLSMPPTNQIRRMIDTRM